MSDCHSKTQTGQAEAEPPREFSFGFDSALFSVAAPSVPTAAGTDTQSQAQAQTSLFRSQREIEALRSLDSQQYRKEAEQGDAKSQVEPGFCLEKGIGADKDEKQAAEWYRKAAEQGNSEAQCKLGMRCEMGDGVEKDDVKAVELYLKAAEQGDALAMNALARCYRNGIGVAVDEKRAFDWYRKAAEGGIESAQRTLGAIYRQGMCGVDRDHKEAMVWFRKAAERGDAQAQSWVGYMLESSSASEAVVWYRKAAEQGHAYSQLKLADCLKNGRGTKKNEVEAVQWYTKAATQGDSDARYRLAVCFRKGTGVIKDDEKAAEWLRKAKHQLQARIQLADCLLTSAPLKEISDEEPSIRDELPSIREAAEQRLRLAQCMLGYCSELAVEWYEKAAEQGDAAAQTHMGVCCEYGAGAWRNETKAMNWYRKAAEQGHANGQFNLALCFERGFGTRKDDTLAAEWYRKAAEQGHTHARFLLHCRHPSPSSAAAIDFARLNYDAAPEASTFGGHNIDTSALPADFVKRFRYFGLALEVASVLVISIDVVKLIAEYCQQPNTKGKQFSGVDMIDVYTSRSLSYLIFAAKSTFLNTSLDELRWEDWQDKSYHNNAQKELFIKSTSGAPFSFHTPPLYKRAGSGFPIKESQQFEHKCSSRSTAEWRNVAKRGKDSKHKGGGGISKGRDGFDSAIGDPFLGAYSQSQSQPSSTTSTPATSDSENKTDVASTTGDFDFSIDQGPPPEVDSVFNFRPAAPSTTIAGAHQMGSKASISSAPFTFEADHSSLQLRCHWPLTDLSSITTASSSSSTVFTLDSQSESSLLSFSFGSGGSQSQSEPSAPTSTEFSSSGSAAGPFTFALPFSSGSGTGAAASTTAQS